MHEDMGHQVNGLSVMISREGSVATYRMSVESNLIETLPSESSAYSTFLANVQCHRDPMECTVLGMTKER